MLRGHNRFALSVALVVGATFLTHPAHAQTPDQQAQIAQVVENLSPVPPDIRMPTIGEMTMIAQAGNRLNDPSGNYVRISAYRQVIEQFEKSFGPQHPLTGRMLVALAQQLTSAQVYDEATALLERAEAILGERLEPGDEAHLNAKFARIALLDLKGRHLEQLEHTEQLADWVARYLPDNEAAAISAQDARSVALFRLGRFPEAATVGADVIARLTALHGEGAPQLASAIAGQVTNLVAAGRLAEAEALLAERSAMATLDAAEHRIPIARLHRAEAAIAEAKLDYDGAKAALDKALAIFDASEYRLPQSPLNPDYGTVAATRTALDMRRLLSRKHHVLGLVQPDWLASVPLKLTIEGTEHLGWDIRREEAWKIGGRLEALAARTIALDHQRSNHDLDLAEDIWRELIAYHSRGTGTDSAITASVRLDLADNLLRNYRPFAAQEEAEAAHSLLAAALGDNHPVTLRAETVRALALARQGRRELAGAAIDTALAKTWEAGEQSKAELLALLTARDGLLRLDGDERARLAFWDVWGARVTSLDVYTAFEQLEAQMRTALFGAQAATNVGQCPGDAEKAAIWDAIDGMTITPPNGGAAYTPSVLLTISLLAKQVGVETLACDGSDPDALFAFLKEQLNSQGDVFANESGASMVARYDRWARLLIRDPEFGRSKEKTELALIFLSRAEMLAERQVANARDGGGVDGEETRQRRVLASEGVGLDYRYALETRLEANWRYAKAQEGLSVDDPNRLFNFNIAKQDGFDEAFTAAQLIRLDGNSQALALASARAAAPDPQLREVVGEYQSLSADLFRLLGNGDSGGELESVQARHAALAALIERDFPDYYRFAAPEPLSHSEAAKALGEGEGLLTIVTVGEDVYVFAVTHGILGPRAWHRIEGGARDVEDLVSILRCDLDPVECGESASVQTRGGGADEVLEGWEGYDFNRNAAFDLYELLIEPVAHVFEGGAYDPRTDRLYVVTSGAASALPLSVLLTQAPEDDGYDTTGTVFRDAPWLGNRFDLAYLPAVSDLASTSRAPSQGSGFVGYGDPALDPAPSGQQRGKRGASLFLDTRGGARPLANPRALMNMKSLPGAEEELKAVSALFPGSGRLVTKASATEPQVKREDAFAGAEVILFSTHGVLPDASAGIAEAGLVFTPPDQATPDDDGLLSASEAAALDFTSDLLVLSACNTATEGSFEGADSLSGLARSFIFAGARSVYASHWRVSDDITKELMLTAIRIAIEQPDLTRSEALRQAMAAIRTGEHADGTPVDGWTPDWSHPSAWAPFVAITSG